MTPARDIRYWEKLDDIAYDVKQMLDTLARPSSTPPTPKPAAGEAKTVYLSETTSERISQIELYAAGGREG